MQSPSTTNWLVPERTDLLMAITAKMLSDGDQAVTPDAQEDDPPPDPSQSPTRSQMWIDQMVRMVRAAIQNAGHTPLSCVPNAVPPEAFEHVVYMAAHRLITSTPNLAYVIVNEKGIYAPLAAMAKTSEEWVDGRAQAGGRIGGIATHAITPPTDPTGRDWTTAVSVDANGKPDWCGANPPIKGTVFSVSVEPPVNMRTPGYGGYGISDEERRLLGRL